jgi:hypothetical protein
MRAPQTGGAPDKNVGPGKECRNAKDADAKNAKPRPYIPARFVQGEAGRGSGQAA